MLEGLEATEINLSDLERTWRIDAEFFRREHVELAKRLSELPCQPVSKIADVSDGNHFSISESFVEKGIPYYRGQDAVGHFFIEQAAPNFITRDAFERPFMRRSHLRQGDVLLSIIGTVGETSLVKTQQLATCSCKLAILRPRAVKPQYLATFLSSRVGRMLSERWKRGAVQTGLLLEDMDQVPVARLRDGLEAAICEAVDRAYETLEASRQYSAEAEDTLMQFLGLAGWAPREPLTYVRNSSEAFALGRLDAQFFSPRVEALLRLLGRDGLRIRDVAPPRHERFSAESTGHFNYIEIGGLSFDGTATSERTLQSEAPSRATQYVRAGDVITSTVRPIRRLTALITHEQDRHVCSSGFVVLTPRSVSGEVLLTYLRLPIVCDLMDLYSSATMYPAISEGDLLNLPIPEISDSTQQRIGSLVQSAAKCQKCAEEGLDKAKRAVEIAIEDGSDAALSYLQGR